MPALSLSGPAIRLARPALLGKLGPLGALGRTIVRQLRAFPNMCAILTLRPCIPSWRTNSQCVVCKVGKFV